MDQNQPPSQPVTPPPVPPYPHQVSPTATGIPMDEVQRGKLFAVLSYGCNFIGLPFFIVPLVMRDNDFSLFHAKQTLMIVIIGLIAAIIAFVLSFFCIGVLLFPVIVIANWVFLIIGLINVSNNQAKPLPVIGGLAESWFSGIRKQQI